MSTVETIESLEATLEPLGALRDEHSQLEEWVRNSFEALEKLHEELATWQTELARKQTELDLREDALEKDQTQDQELEAQLAACQRDLDEARDEIRQLEEEGVEQLQTLENLERLHAVLKVETNTANQRVEELSAALEAERFRAADEQHLWRSDLKEMRRLLEKQCLLLEDFAEDDGHAPLTETIEEGGDTTSVDVPVVKRSTELRRRAKSRLAAKRRKRRDAD